MNGLLLIHAFPLDARMWSPQLGGPRAVAPSLPGFGGTAPAADGVMTMGEAAGRCVDALDAAGIDRAVVCGLSVGGYVAFELWRTARSRIAGLVLANTRSEPDAAEARAARVALAERLRREGNVLADSPPPLLSPEAPDEMRGWIRELIADQPAEAIAAASLGMAERPDSGPDLPTIDVPTLVVTSDRDELIPMSVSAPMADAIPGAELAVIAGAGHLSNVERPEEFSALLSRHLERCGGPDLLPSGGS